MKGFHLFILAAAICCSLSLDFPSSEVFVLPLLHTNFSLPTSDVTYKPSLLEMPDLPSWLHYIYSEFENCGFLYGAPPFGSKDIKVEVIAVDKETYNVSRRVLDLNINNKPVKSNEIRFKITNMNIDEMIAPEWWKLLNVVLVEDLWPESRNDGAIVSLDSATQKGDRLPLSPQDKEGVYVSYGSSSPFSSSLRSLEMEVKPLWHHRPCPKYFKKTSYERFFRLNGFAIDWCSFKLHSNHINEDSTTNMKKRTEVLSRLKNSPPIKLMKQSEVEKRSYVWDVIRTILIPLLVMIALLALLTLAMCCHRTSMDLQSSVFFDEIFDDFPRMPTAQEIHMVQYAGMNKAVDAMRSIRGIKDKRDHSPHPSMATTTTHVDTLPRSPTASPDSTLPRTSTPSRRYEDYAILTRPDPPPYQRNGSTLVRHE